MSSEDNFNFDNDGDDQEQDDFGQEGGDEQEGDGQNETPEQKYQRAKNLLGFEDFEAIDIFYDIYVDPNATVTLQGKSLKRAAITLSQYDDYERVLGALTDVFGAYNDKIIDENYCSKIVRKMMLNIRNEQALTDFLNTAAENIDKSTQLQLFIDVKLRQAELALKKSEFNEAREELTEVEQFVGTTPDKKDTQMCNSLIRILFLKIEIEEVFSKDENAIFDYYKSLKNIDPNLAFSQDRQKAVIKKIEGQMALYNRDFNAAVDLFHDAFKDFDSSGSEKKIDCLPFLALAIMCTRDLNNMNFQDPLINPYINHPIVAPLKQLLDAFMLTKYVKFDYLLDSAKKIFMQKIQNADFYFDLLDEVRVFVLRNNIKIFCPSYKKIEFDFLSKEFKCPIEEAQRLIYDLIVSDELRALVDTDANLVILKKIAVPSPYLENVQTMLNSVGETVKRQSKLEKIIIE